MELRLDWANVKGIFLLPDYQQFLEKKVVIDNCVKIKFNILGEFIVVTFML